MKKIKITLNNGSPKETLLLFTSPEAAYAWAIGSPKERESFDVGEMVGLDVDRDDFIEVEWYGCEYAYDGPEHTRLDLVRAVKAHQPQNSSGLMVSIHSGWTCDSIVPFREFKDDHITISVVSPKDERFNFNELFAAVS